MSEHSDKKVIIIGGGPAGLTAAYELCKVGIQSVVLEKDNMVGGLSRTVDYNGYHFDIGGHRFFTKVKAVDAMWHEVLDADFLRRSRLSRIYYDKKFFHYPLRPVNALFGLGLWNSFLVFLSYINAQILPRNSDKTLEQWVSKRFGRRLYEIFFQSYTEKVWGVPCTEISAEWAAQRIKGLSLITALKNALSNQNSNNKGAVITTLIDAFDYPKQGPGMMWRAVADIVQNNGGRVCLGTEVERLSWADNRVDAVGIKSCGRQNMVGGTDFITSMPIRELIRKLDPPVPQEVLKAANSLNYRDFVTVAVIVNKCDVFPDNWIYVHDPDVKVGRIQNYKNWSPYMVPDQEKTCLGLEYFCFEGDELWTMPDGELIELAKSELDALGLVHASEVEDGTVVRMPKAYPVYDATYRESLQTIRQFLTGIGNLQLVGRNGMHKYNNQDHSMLTAMLATKNILGENHDLWEVNADQEYHEEITDYDEEADKISESRPEELVSDEVVVRAFARIDKLALATAVGSVCGFAIFTATLWLVIKGGYLIGPNLQLLGQYFTGYTVTVTGAFIGMGYSFIWGCLFGWLFAYLRNFFLASYVYLVKKKTELLTIEDFFDHF